MTVILLVCDTVQKQCYSKIFIVAILDLQISPIFLRSISQWDINLRVSEDSSPRALSNGACNVIVDKTVAKPRPPKLNTNKNEASSDSAQPIFRVRVSIDSSFSEQSSTVVFVSVPLARAKIF